MMFWGVSAANQAAVLAHQNFSRAKGDFHYKMSSIFNALHTYLIHREQTLLNFEDLNLITYSLTINKIALSG